MLILHDQNNNVIGLQLFPETSDQPHIFAQDSLFDLLKPLIGKITLVSSGEDLFLPDNIQTLANEISLASAKQQKITQLNSNFKSALEQGVDYDFNGEADFVQTRDERDLINISGVASRAMILQGQGITDAVINFRASSNTTYQLTPAQAIQLGEAVALKLEQLYGTLWALKDAVETAATALAIDAITWPE